MTKQIASIPLLRVWDNSGNLAVGGSVYTYQAGTTTPVATYTDSAGGTPNANPIILNSRGEANIWLTATQSYKLVAYDALGNLLWTEDNIIPTGLIFSPTTGAGLIGYQQQGSRGLAKTVAFQLNQLSYTGRVTMFQNASLAWCVFDNYGNLVDISASTTNGLQEAINLATTVGLNLYVIGGGTSRTADFGLINCSTGIVWPPLRTMQINLDGVHIIFSSSVTGTGMFFDSLMEVKFNLTGEITYQGNGAPVLFKPTNAIPVDTLTTIIDSQVSIGSIACVGGTPTCCIQFDPSIANILGNEFNFLELNGSGGVGSPGVASFGIQVLTPGVSTVWSGNTINVADIHHITSAGIQEGVNTTRQGNLACNTYNIGKITPIGGAAISGFNSFGIDSITTIGSITPISSTIQYGVVLQVGSIGHQIQVGSISGYSASAIRDLGTLNTVTHDGGTYVGGIRSVSTMLATVNAINNAAGVTLTSAMLLGQIISHTGAVAVTDTTDTAANIIAAIPGAFVGYYFWVKIMNFNSGTLTINAGVGVNLVGVNTIAAGTSHDFMIRIDNVNATACSIFG